MGTFSGLMGGGDKRRKLADLSARVDAEAAAQSQRPPALAGVKQKKRKKTRSKK